MLNSRGFRNVNKMKRVNLKVELPMRFISVQLLAFASLKCVTLLAPIVMLLLVMPLAVAAERFFFLQKRGRSEQRFSRQTYPN